MTCRQTRPCSGWSKDSGTVPMIRNPSDCQRHDASTTGSTPSDPDWSGRQHDLARNVPGRLGHEGLARVGERVDRADLGPQRALINQAGDLPELGTARVAYEVNHADVVSIGLHWLHDGHQGTTGLDDCWRTGEHVTADAVVDQVDLTDGRLPAVPLDVDEIAGAEFEHAPARTGPAGSDDVGAGPAGQLHAHRSDPAAGAVDHHGLAGLKVAVVEQRLPRREPGLRDRSGFDEIDRRRLGCQAASLDGHVLGGPPVPVAVDESVDLVAHRYAGSTVAERDHDARPLVG